MGATLAVLPHYVKDNLNGSDLEVGIVSGAFALTGIVCRPIAGNLADRRGRKPTVIVGALLAAIAGFLYFVPAGIPGLIIARFFLGAGEGTVFTAGSAWNVDMAPEERRGRMIGLYGLAIWTGLTLGPADRRAAAARRRLRPGLGLRRRRPAARRRDRLAAARRTTSRARTSIAAPSSPARRSARASPSRSASSASPRSPPSSSSAWIERGIGHGPAVFSVFAATVVATRLVAGGLPDRIGAARCAVGAALVETVGLVLLGAADDLLVVIFGAIGMGAAFSLLFPSLSLVAINRVGPERRGVAMGTFTANFDLGMLIGSPLVGAAAAIGGLQRRLLRRGRRRPGVRGREREVHRRTDRCSGASPRYAAGLMAQRGTAAESTIDRKTINKLTEEQMARFREHTPTSAEYFDRARKVMPGGVPSSFQLNDPVARLHRPRQGRAGLGRRRHASTSTSTTASA